MKECLHKGHRERLRNRVKKESLINFEDYQVLEYALSFVIPYKDTNPIAHKLINKFGSFYGVLEADEDALMEVEGMGEVSAHFLSNLLKIYHYYEQDKSRKTAIVIGAEQAYNFVRQFLQDKLIEELYIVCLTPKNKVVAVEKISEGTSSEARVSMRTIIEKMGRAKVSNIIVAHNHPKGKAEPSEDDNKFTKALMTTLAINGCHLLDHIIIGEDKGEYYSYQYNGILDKFMTDIAEIVNYQAIAQPKARYGVDNDKEW